MRRAVQFLRSQQGVKFIAEFVYFFEDKFITEGIGSNDSSKMSFSFSRDFDVCCRKDGLCRIEKLWLNY